MEDLYYRAVPFTADGLTGSFEGVKRQEGHLCLDEVKEGQFVSAPISLPECDTLLVSWCCYRRGGSVEMLLSYEKADGTYSDFFSFGEWSAKPCGKSRKTDEGIMDQDTLLLPCKTTRVIVKARLTTGTDGSGDPWLLRFAVAYNGTPCFAVDTAALPNEVLLDVPPRSQMLVPVIGNIICSPTSTSMCMDCRGLSLPTADVAAMCYDHGENIYGNWLFNVACAGEQGFEAHFDMYDVEAAMHCLAQGVPLAFSIQSVEGQITNAPQAYRHGHLICVIGYKTVNGRLHFVVNDPASGDISAVRRLYDAQELRSAWKMGAVYVIK